MQLLCHKQQLMFINGGGGDNFTLAPNPGIQTAPDWIRDTNTFRAAAKASLIVEVGVIAQPAEVPVEPVTESVAKPEMVEAKAEPVTGLSANTGKKAKAA
jgi:hypothetical protein